MGITVITASLDFFHRRMLALASLLLWTFGLLFHSVSGADFAFLVGAGKYDPNEFPPMPKVVNEITEFDDILRGCGFADDNRFVLHDDCRDERRPTKQNILDRLDELAEQITYKDRLFLVLVGHGVQSKDEQELSFCPVDAQNEKRDSQLSLRQMLVRCAKRPHDDAALGLELIPSRLILVVDVCRKSEVRAPEEEELFLEGNIFGTGRPPEGSVSFIACRKNQGSKLDKQDRSYFLRAVSDGLRGEANPIGGDASLEVGELKLYIQDRLATVDNQDLDFLQNGSGPQLEILRSHCPRYLTPFRLPHDFTSKPRSWEKFTFSGIHIGADTLEQLDFYKCRFVDCTFLDTVFGAGTNVSKVTFEGCVLNGADFRKASGTESVRFADFVRGGKKTKNTLQNVTWPASAKPYRLP